MLIADLSQLWLLLDENGKKNNILRIIQQSLFKHRIEEISIVDSKYYIAQNGKKGPNYRTYLRAES